MSSINAAPTVEELLERHKTACDLRQRIDQTKIRTSLLAWAANVTKEPMTVRFTDSEESMKRDAWDAWDAWDARDAWDAWAARDARDAWAARAARDARAARAARDARDAWAAWAARDARDAWAARAAWDAWDCSWLPIISIGALSRADGDTFRTWYPLLEAFEAGAWLFWIVRNEIVVAQVPLEVHVDERRRLHCATGPAFSWHDINEYYWHGVLVPRHVVEKPDSITVSEIEKEPNMEIRRVMVERYGMGRYIIDTKAQLIHQDEWGTLFWKDVPGGDPIVMVKVVNSTQEADGSFKDYFLRVHPELRPLPPGHWTADQKREFIERGQPQALTALNAVASTFGKRGEEYAPLVQT